MNDNRKNIILIFIVLVGLVLLVRLFFIQVVNEEFKRAADNNAVQRLVDYPYRGLIYDRHDKLLVYNDPVFDLMVIPRNVQIKDTTLFCNLFKLTKEELIEKYEVARKYSQVKPSVFIKQISNADFAKIQDYLIDFRGFFIVSRSVRAYPEPIMANALGYIGEISKRRLEIDTTKYYKSGDYIGIGGMEAYYEQTLRGTRGAKYRLVNVRGVEKGSYKNGEFDTLSIPGNNIISTIDRDLQKYGEFLMNGKVGSVVAIEPSSGEILAMISAPSYDPNLLTGAQFSEQYAKLNADTTKPLFVRPIMAMYPPGSIFKIVQSLIGMQEGVFNENTIFPCNKSLVNCHVHPNPVNLEGAIRYSCNPYFHQAYKRIINQELSPNDFTDSKLGLDKWKEQVLKFGLGQPLGVDLFNERGGQIPGSNYYDKIYGAGRWRYRTIYSLSIGQGEMLVTPLQMANLAALVANKGYYYTPHLVKSITGDDDIDQRFKVRNESGIDAKHFDIVHEAMIKAVSGTAARAVMKDIVMAGKTGTAENPGIDHSVFIAFAPAEDPKIAIAVYVENAGWGGRAAASTASLMIEKYLKGQITRPALEEYVLKGEFIY